MYFNIQSDREQKQQRCHGQISPNIKEERSKKLIKLSDIVGEEIRNTYIGRKVEVLIEEKQNDGYWKGHTKNYIYVGIKSKEKDIKNKIIYVTIKENRKDQLIGEK